jgi:hypothetical protein
MRKGLLKSGDILAYYNHEDNPYHHRTYLFGYLEIGKLIELGQWRYLYWADPKVTHVSLVKGHSDEVAKSGQAPVDLIDILKGKRVEVRPLEHNYAYWVFRLKREKNIHPNFSPEDLAEKSTEVAQQFEGREYNYSHIGSVLMHEPIPDRYYLQSLVDRFNIDFEDKTFGLKNGDKLICAELIVLSYQIAWLLLAGPEAVNQPLPAFLNIHYLCTPSRVTQFFADSEYFDEVPAAHIHELRYSGTPDPRDSQMPNYVNNRLLMKGYRENRKQDPQPTSSPAACLSAW